MESSHRIDPTRLIDFATAVYAGAGVPETDAQLIADTLVQADLWGHQSHGVLRLGWYLDRIHHGVMQPITTPEVVVDAGAIAVLDGHDGVGQVLAMRATQEAISRARAHGIGAVAVRNSNHFGTCMYYTRRVAAAGCVALLTSNGGPAMAPWGGRKKILGTNPWSVAAPVGHRAPFVVDMAATGVARGKIYLARNQHMPIPLGWAINQAGEPTTDPQEAIDGIILPMAEHKGYAIAAMVDMLSGVLTGSGFLSAVHSPYHTSEPSHCGHLLIALDIAKFQPLEHFTARMEAFVNEIKAVPLAKGFDEVFYPGEIEDKHDAQGRREGLALPADTLADLQRIARRTGLEASLPE
ncbi:MAG: Ldh family oxidoreductase [Candidatus Tectimicrobiota bacterium]